MALPINCNKVCIILMASGGRENSSALSNTIMIGATASSQNCCRRLVVQSVLSASLEIFADTTASIFGHLVHRKSGIPNSLIFVLLTELSILDLKAISRNALATSNGVTSWSSTLSCDSPSSSNSSISLSAILSLLAGRSWQDAKSLSCELAYGILPLLVAWWPRVSSQTAS